MALENVGRVSVRSLLLSLKPKFLIPIWILQHLSLSPCHTEHSTGAALKTTLPQLLFL